jgi:hypothetical protein
MWHQVLAWVGNKLLNAVIAECDKAERAAEREPAPAPKPRRKVGKDVSRP